MKLADKFTMTRVVLSPVFFILYFLPVWFNVSPLIPTIIIIPLIGFMEFTDFLDGFFARKRNEVSDFGKIFDPFADVLVHLTTLFCLVVSDYFSPLIFVLILYREFGMNFVRLMAIQKGVAIGARKGGKLKTVLYVVTSFYYMAIEFCIRFGVDLTNTFNDLMAGGLVLSIICVVVAYVSFADYLIHFKSLLKGEK